MDDTFETRVALALRDALAQAIPESNSGQVPRLVVIGQVVVQVTDNPISAENRAVS